MAIQSAKTVDKDEQRLDELDAELRAAVNAEDEGNVIGPVHPFLTAQCYAAERRNLKATYVQATVSARVRRRSKDHQGAEHLFKEALKARDGIVAVEQLVAKEPADVRDHYKTILDDWEQDLLEDLEKRTAQREARRQAGRAAR